MKKVKKEKKKVSKFRFIISIFFLFLSIILGIFAFFYYNKNYVYKFELNKNDISIKLNDVVNPEEYIKIQKNVEIIYKNIKTDVIGKKYIIYKVTDKFNNIHSYYLEVNILDDVAPKIEGKNKVSLYVGDKIDLKKYIKVSDNYDKDLDINIEGEVDNKKEGEYQIKYIVYDKSNNKAEHIITFIVKKRTIYEPVKLESGVQGTTSKGYKIENKNGLTYINGIVVVNKTYNLSSNYGSGLTSSTKNAFDELKAAASVDGYDLYVGSGFRSFNTQKSIYKNYVKRDGQAKADTYSARPGYSEHQTGLAIDICSHNEYKACINSKFNDTQSAKWLNDNAYKYGFVLRYPNRKTNETGYKFESWHYRYVGKDLAEKLYNNGNWITLESYLGITSKYND